MNSTRALFAIPVLAFLKLTACSSAGDLPAIPAEGTPDGGDITNPDKGPGGDASPNVVPDAGPTPDASVVVPSACAVTQKGTAGVVLVGTLLLPDSVENGEVLVDAKGVIACAAKDCSADPGYAAATVVKCKDAVISPGLINPHDHISFADVPPQITSERYEHRHDWRKGLRGHKKVGTPKVADAKQAVRAAELRFLAGGATSSVSSGGTPGLIRNLDGSAASLEGLTAKSAVFDTFPLGDSSGGMISSGCAYPSRTTSESIAGNDGYLPHIAEGVDTEAHNEMVCQSGTGPDAAAFDLVQRQSAIIHGIAVTADEVAHFRSQRAALVWSPRSNISLYGNTAPAVMYDQLGVQIALGTDWLPSGSMNLQRELKCADELNQKHFDKHFSDKALWQMVTANAAFAAGMAHTIGYLKPGYIADIAIFNAKSNKQYRAVIDAQPDDVVLVMRGGKALYGDATVLDGLDGAACEPLPVCGVAKKACVQKDTGTSLADVMADGTKVYPLFFCKGETITNEPSCSPVRADYKSGSSGSIYSGVASGDKDGDGIEDAKDNCPSIFSPVRPMDKSVQADTDGDGLGDACDKCPFEAGEACTVPSANDIDGDTVVNGTDNCPEDANTDQADADNDGKGDLCDKCPTEPNPGAGVCTLALTVAELRNPALPTHPAAGSVRAKVTGLEVTAVKSVGGGDQGFFVQLPGATTFGALFVATMNPTVKVGNVVDVTGTYEEVFGISYLTTPQITVTDSKTTSTIVPLVLDSALVGNKTTGEPYEGMLVQVGPVAITKLNPDTPKDYDEFEVTGPLRVDDYVYDALDNAAAVGTSFTKIVGIAGWSFANRKLWPRDAADSQ